MALYDTANNFFLSDGELVNTPSRQAGISEEEELRTRLRACDNCVHGLRLLRCPQQVLCSAQVFIHRFYCKCRVDEHEPKYVAMAAAWLASKIEEAGVRLKNLIPVFQQVEAKRTGKKTPLLDPTSDDFFKTKQKLVVVEKELLKSFRFLLHTAHPHSFRTTLCVRYKCEVIACGAIFMAARKMKKPLPENPPWYELFCARKEELYDVMNVMLDLYSRPPQDFCPVPLITEKQAAIEASPPEGTSQQSPSTHHRSGSKVWDQADGSPKSANSGSLNRPEVGPGNSEKVEPKKQGEIRTPRSHKREREGDRPREAAAAEDGGGELHASLKRHRRDRGRDRGRERDKDRGRRKSRSLSRGDRDKRRERSSREHRRPSRRGGEQYRLSSLPICFHGIHPCL